MYAGETKVNIRMEHRKTKLSDHRNSKLADRFKFTIQCSTDHIEKAVLIISGSIFSENVIGMKLELGEDIEHQQLINSRGRDFQQFGINCSLEGRRL